MDRLRKIDRRPAGIDATSEDPRVSRGIADVVQVLVVMNPLAKVDEGPADVHARRVDAREVGSVRHVVQVAIQDARPAEVGLTASQGVLIDAPIRRAIHHIAVEARDLPERDQVNEDCPRCVCAVVDADDARDGTIRHRELPADERVGRAGSREGRVHSTASAVEPRAGSVVVAHVEASADARCLDRGGQVVDLAGEDAIGRSLVDALVLTGAVEHEALPARVDISAGRVLQRRHSQRRVVIRHEPSRAIGPARRRQRVRRLEVAVLDHVERRAVRAPAVDRSVGNFVLRARLDRAHEVIRIPRPGHGPVYGRVDSRVVRASDNRGDDARELVGRRRRNRVADTAAEVAAVETAVVVDADLTRAARAGRRLHPATCLNHVAGLAGDALHVDDGSVARAVVDADVGSRPRVRGIGGNRPSGLEVPAIVSRLERRVLQQHEARRSRYVCAIGDDLAGPVDRDAIRALDAEGSARRDVVVVGRADDADIAP